MRPDRQLLRLRHVLPRLLLVEWGERRRRDDDKAGRGEDGDAQHGGGGLGGAELGLDEVARAVALHARGHGDSGGDEHAAGLDDDGHERLVDAALERGAWPSSPVGWPLHWGCSRRRCR